MSNLKDLFMEIGDTSLQDDEGAIEVLADNVKQALDLAARELGIDVHMLDYEILEKGTGGIFGIGRQPYRVLVKPLGGKAGQEDLAELENKLMTEHSIIRPMADDKNVDGDFKVKVLRSGVWLTVSPPKGRGRKVDLGEVNARIFSMKINPDDLSKIEKEVKKASGKPVRLGDWAPNPEYDGSISLEMADDEMRAFVHFLPPRFNGRHIEFEEILDALKRAGAVSGIREEAIKDYLDKMDYNVPLLAAEGARPKNGRDAFIDYKVKVDKSEVAFEEDESGKVDFRNIELLENVVVGQLMAVKVPAEQGIPGRTITNRILPAKTGKDVKFLHGKGTILSEDGTELTAEINGQVMFKAGKISVDPIYLVKGDVSLETGNITFLGSVIISGSVQDNFEVKAAGNVEVKGSVAMASIEAEGDIIVYQGIMGRDKARIESTGGSIYAKFIQNGIVIAEKEVVVPEGILHSRVDAGERVVSMGRRARIVGGVIRATEEVNARFLGADVSTKTEIRVGINPKVLQQITDLTSLKEKSEEELIRIKLDLRTIEGQKRSGTKLPPEREKLFQDLQAQSQKLTSRLEEIKGELEELNAFVNQLEHKGKICAEKTAFPGCEFHVKDKKFPQLKDPYNHVKFTLEGGEIKITEYEYLEGMENKAFAARRRRR